MEQELEKEEEEEGSILVVFSVETHIFWDISCTKFCTGSGSCTSWYAICSGNGSGSCGGMLHGKFVRSTTGALQLLKN